MKYLKNVTTIKLDSSICTNCKQCINVCPREVFFLREGYGVDIKDADSCIECGACAKNCLAGAVSVKSGVGSDRFGSGHGD